MISFHKAEAADRVWAHEILKNCEYPGAEYAFSCMYLWSDYFGELGRVGDHLTQHASWRGREVYLYPAGAGDIKGAIEAIRADAAERGGPLRLRSLTKDKKEELEALGMEAILTRSDERALAQGKKADMAARGKIMNGEGVDLVVSVHMNKFTDPSVHGPMAFYMKGSAEGEKLAKTVIDSITDELGAPRRIANPGDYYVIRESMPVSVLVECGFLSNSGDEALLQQEQHQKKLAHAIARGIFSYFEGDLGRKPLD